jgi:hypothetical protein
VRSDAVEAIGIDERGSLWVKPATAAFPYIYREAMEVHWDVKRSCLYSPVPRKWSYLDWFRQIKAAAREQGVELEVSQATSWVEVDPALRQAISNE